MKKPKIILFITLLFGIIFLTGVYFYIPKDIQRKYQMEEAKLTFDKSNISCKLNNGYYKIVYDNKSMHVLNHKIRIYDSIFEYRLPHASPGGKIEWISERIFTLKSKPFHIDSSTKEISFMPRLQTFVITDCKKDTLYFIEKDGLKNSTGNNQDLSGRIIKSY